MPRHIICTQQMLIPFNFKDDCIFSSLFTDLHLHCPTWDHSLRECWALEMLLIQSEMCCECDKYTPDFTMWKNKETSSLIIFLVTTCWKNIITDTVS